jgi:hypothetical protein
VVQHQIKKGLLEPKFKGSNNKLDIFGIYGNIRIAMLKKYKNHETKTLKKNQPIIKGNTRESAGKVMPVKKQHFIRI